METQPAPVVKWVGGKRQLQEAIKPLLLENFDSKTGRYFEPFVGGGALFFALKPSHSLISDLNTGLINLYLCIRDNSRELLMALLEIERQFNALPSPKKKEYFLQERLHYNQGARAGVNMAARFVFLNKAGFNGMYRENKQGDFTIPFGEKKSVKLLSEAAVDAAARCLISTEILNVNFDMAVRSASQGDLVYFDPPYIPLSPTSSFTSYHSDGFGFDDQLALRDLALELTEKGVNVVLSNSSSPLVSDLYQKFKIVPITAQRNLSGLPIGRRPVTEFVISNSNLL